MTEAEVRIECLRLVGPIRASEGLDAMLKAADRLVEYVENAVEKKRQADTPGGQPKKGSEVQRPR